MKSAPWLLVLAVSCLASCGRDEGPPLSVSNVRIFAPLPGRSTSVAYMDLHNNSRRGISIERISTPAFARAEIHETTITNGVASMRSVGSLQIAAKSQLSFAPGGLHAMLIQPLQGLVPGSTVQLEIRYNDGGLLIVAAPVLTRLDENSN